MKKLIAFLSLAIIFALGACSTTGAPPNPANLLQVATSFCPLVNADLTVLSTSPAVTAPLQAQFKQILTINQGVCAAGTGMTITNLQDLNTKVVSAAIAILLANPAIPNQPVILLALQLGQPLVTQAIAQLQAAQATTPAAAPAAPAVAPAAAAVQVS